MGKADLQMFNPQGSEFNPFELAPSQQVSQSRGNTANTARNDFRRKSATSASPSMTGAAKSAKTSQSKYRASFVDKAGRERLVAAGEVGDAGRGAAPTEPPSAIPRLGQ